MRELRKESGVLRATMSTYMLSAARDRESRRERPPKTDRAPGAQGRAGSECGVGGVRSMRYSMLVEDGEVVKLNVEDPGRFEVSDAETMLNSL